MKNSMRSLHFLFPGFALAKWTPQLTQEYPRSESDGTHCDRANWPRGEGVRHLLQTTEREDYMSYGTCKLLLSSSE